MKQKLSAYWICQLGGWIFYGLAILFFVYSFDKKLNPLFVNRLILIIILGVIFTHLLRYLIHTLKLTPPLKSNSLVKLLILVSSICIIFSIVSSTLIQWLGWFDPFLKGDILKRFMFTLIEESPIIFVWSSLYYIWHFVEADKKDEVNKVKLEGLVKELELKTIKSHINPHFIFNSLNSIRALVDENPERARTAITELSNILRSSMQAEKSETSPLEKELGIVKDYLALEHIRFEDRLKVEYDIDEETLGEPVPPMMLQTLVENAIKHGISKRINGGFVKIISRIYQQQRELIVQSTGTLEENYKSEGFGVSSTQNRLLLMYGSDAKFELKNLSNGIVEAKVIMPFIK